MVRTGLTIAAVPAPNTSIILPSSAAWAISDIVNLRSDIVQPLGPSLSRARVRTESLVTPSKIVPSSGAVMSSFCPVSLFFNATKRFMVPTSVTYSSSPNSHRFCWWPFFAASV
ncbi:hypothetical protein ACKS0A_06861 [Histoplasma ohiense]